MLITVIDQILLDQDLKAWRSHLSASGLRVPPLLLLRPVLPYLFTVDLRQMVVLHSVEGGDYKFASHPSPQKVE